MQWVRSDQVQTSQNTMVPVQTRKPLCFDHLLDFFGFDNISVTKTCFAGVGNSFMIFEAIAPLLCFLAFKFEKANSKLVSF